MFRVVRLSIFLIFVWTSACHAQIKSLKLSPSWLANDTDTSVANADVGTLMPIPTQDGRSYTYALVSGNGDTDNSSFSIDGDKLKVLKGTKLTHPSGNRKDFVIRVKVSDGAIEFQRALIVNTIKPKNATSANQVKALLEIPASNIVDRDVVANLFAANFNAYTIQNIAKDVYSTRESQDGLILRELRQAHDNSTDDASAMDEVFDLIEGADENYQDTALYRRMIKESPAQEVEAISNWVGLIRDWDDEVSTFFEDDYREALGELIGDGLPALVVAIENAHKVSRGEAPDTALGGRGSATDPFFVTPRILRYLKHRDARSARYEHRLDVYESRYRAYQRR
jgi:hypothetical protein